MALPNGSSSIFLDRLRAPREKARLGVPAIKQVQIKRHSLFLGYVFF
jgi:hypothetical protein